MVFFLQTLSKTKPRLQNWNKRPLWYKIYDKAAMNLIFPCTEKKDKLKSRNVNVPENYFEPSRS